MIELIITSPAFDRKGFIPSKYTWTLSTFRRTQILLQGLCFKQKTRSKSKLRKKNVEKAIEDHIIAKVEIVGVYSRR